MNCTFNDNNGHQISASVYFDFEGEDTLAVFECEVNLEINWDIDLIVLRYHRTGITINTGRGNDIPLDNVIGKQLLELATPGLKIALYKHLPEAQKQQIINLGKAQFDKVMPITLQEKTEFELTVLYLEDSYLVRFIKSSGSTPNDMEWEIGHIERRSL
ncbi:hypothetical protein DBR40_07450 [Pedobacter sp. KBW01]|uniref:hypothetical protein n=1 Tax=Pedobacter sp. KBW01 TaxID=2153364 RepID=UPI000F5B44FB|nr:hypothetical protein [Pedobacter sp. KBW01]RQO77802.1 hypothetical protein DBR40_07450 [Pedobacter sp. KBW01]